MIVLKAHDKGIIQAKIKCHLETSPIRMGCKFKRNLFIPGLHIVKSSEKCGTGYL